ncbi:hypothetical protein CTA1_3751 [Colletotrichum tanaceti]|uniref:Uncharacterized protein n=1 Tax=Colletotrichum tanaceti TaxID=1306861 RepID=A0A4U6XKU0_9PEZI|nr:hypothetical protein CTA1_3751 [Colletotrichum tanaceti]
MASFICAASPVDNVSPIAAREARKSPPPGPSKCNSCDIKACRAKCASSGLNYNGCTCTGTPLVRGLRNK